ncbi:MAG TPA: hypothetical protein DD384_02740 [Firmicutes bacterium]|nr:hypothetical protein [Bacillota bacterium]
MELNLTAQNKQEELVLKYLQNNASEVLASKINNGTPFEKDGKTLTNKKTLSGFMKYACNNAQELSEKGATSACIDDQTVYGWAIHFFEEDSIVGTLYNDDGTEYKSVTKPVQNNTIKPKPQPQKPKDIQFSIFDDLTEQEVKNNEMEELNTITEKHSNMEKSETQIEKPSKIESPNTTFYDKYLVLQQQNPKSAVAYRLGDFYEILGENAVEIAREIDLTLTSRDCGLEERVPMIGFPYHAAENYFSKIAKTHNLLVVETDGTTRRIEQIPNKNERIVDAETGEILGEDLEPNDTVISKLFEIFGNMLEVQ